MVENSSHLVGLDPSCSGHLLKKSAFPKKSLANDHSPTAVSTQAGVTVVDRGGQRLSVMNTFWQCAA